MPQIVAQLQSIGVKATNFATTQQKVVRQIKRKFVSRN